MLNMGKRHADKSNENGAWLSHSLPSPALLSETIHSANSIKLAYSICTP